MTTVSNLRVKFTVDSNQFRRQLAQTGQMVRRAAAGFAAIGAAAGAFTLQLAQAAAEQRRMLRESGLTIESFSRLRFVAQRSGIEVQQMADAMHELQNALGEAAAETGTKRDALERLNLQYGTLRRMSPERQFWRIVESLRAVRDDTDRVFLGNELLGGAYQNLAPLINSTNSEYRELRTEAAKVSSLTEDQLKTIADLSGQWETYKQQLADFTMALAADWGPTFVAEFGKMRTALVELFEAMEKVGNAWDLLTGVDRDAMEEGRQRLQRNLMFRRGGRADTNRTAPETPTPAGSSVTYNPDGTVRSTTRYDAQGRRIEDATVTTARESAETNRILRNMSEGALRLRQ